MRLNSSVEITKFPLFQNVNINLFCLKCEQQAQFIGYLFFSVFSPRPHMSTLGPSAPGPITFISAGFHFLPVSVIKCSFPSSLFTSISDKQRLHLS